MPTLTSTGTGVIPTLSQEDLTGDRAGFKNALKEGAFYLEMPEECKKLVPSAKKFADRFYQDEKIKSLDFGGFSKYHSRDGVPVQIESFYVEKEFWGRVFKDDLSDLLELGKRMDDLALDILQKSLETVGVPEEDWSRGTGGLLQGTEGTEGTAKGLHHFSFNHYRSKKDGVGSNPSIDFGHTTVLFPNRQGYQVKKDDEWLDVHPKEGYFLINIGRALQMLVNDSQVLRGSLHRVSRVHEDQVTFGLCLDNSADLPVYQKAGDGRLEKVFDTAKEYLKDCFQQCYQ